jgi:hypothetical protein
VSAERAALVAERAALAESAPATLNARGRGVATANPGAWARIAQINQRIAQIDRATR